MFDDILGTIDYDKQLLKDKLGVMFKKHYKYNIVRIELLHYAWPNSMMSEIFLTGGPDFKDFYRQYLVPILKEFQKSEIILSDIDYDCGKFSVDIQW
jgi:hypothetical protein